MKKSWDWLAIYPLIFYVFQLTLPLNYFENNITTYLMLNSSMFFIYLLYSFYYIFKINKHKEKIWKIRKAVRSIFFLIVFISFCFYFLSNAFHKEVNRMSLEILKGNMELTYNYLQIMKKTNLYYRLGLGTLTVGLIGLISFWKEFKN